MQLSRSEKFSIQLRKQKKEQVLKAKKLNTTPKDDDWESMFAAPKEDQFDESLNLILNFG